MKAKILSRQNGILKLQHPDGHVSFGYCKEIAGHKYRASGYRTRKKAEDALDALRYRQHLVSIGAPVPSEPVTFKRLAASFLEDAEGRGVVHATIRSTRTILARFGSLLARNAVLTSITPEHLRQYRTLRRDANLHPHTISYELKRLRTVLRSARRLFDVTWTPPDSPEVKRVHKGRTIILSEEQIATLLNAARPDLHDLVTVALHTALRANELLSISRENTDLSAGIDSRFGRLRIANKKAGTSDTLPLTQEAAAILRRRLEQNERAFPFGYDAARHQFIRTCRRAKIPYGTALAGGITLHTLRHTSTSYLMSRGVGLSAIQAICRHSHGQMTLLYSHAQPADVGAAISRLGDITRKRSAK